MPNSTHTDVAQKEDSHALSRMLDDEGLAASSAPPTTGASPDAENSVDMTGAIDLLPSSATSMWAAVPVPTMDGADFNIAPAEPLDLMASYDAHGRVYQGWGYMLNGPGRVNDDQAQESVSENGDANALLDLTASYDRDGNVYQGLGYMLNGPGRVNYHQAQDAALDLMVADDQSDDVDEGWVMLPTQADGEDIPPADAPGYSIASLLGAAFIIGVGFGWGSEVAP